MNSDGRVLSPAVCKSPHFERMKTMETLIELYDERPLENVLAAEIFRPARVVYICPGRIASNQKIQQNLRRYYHHRGLKTELIFLRASIYDTEAIKKLLLKVVNQYPDCSIDITGGTDAVLFASGQICTEVDIPVFTYSRKNKQFYNIRNATFANGRKCTLTYSVEDCILMAGGTMKTGRFDNSILHMYSDDIDPFFGVYMKHRRQWVKAINYIQRLSPGREDGSYALEVSGSYAVKGERGSRINAPELLLQDLEEIGLISKLVIQPEQSVSFRFRDGRIRSWLRDVGSVLELYVYKTCLDTGLFQDVITSAVIDWEGSGNRNSVTNEIDVLCTSGITPLFISCKTCDAKTEALNELAVLRDRFGGQIARAAIVTAESGGIPLRNRAAELGIVVIDLNDLNAGKLSQRIKKLMRE